MKVYVVTRIECEWQEVVAVYSSKEEARKRANEETGPAPWGDRAEILEFELEEGEV